MIKKTVLLALASVVLAGIALAGTAQARDQIRIVGSSTVYPFATVVAETFGRSTSFKTPVVESTGSGGGLKLFCAGVGVGHPDIANASRRIKKSEIADCAKNGVTGVIEVKIGYDGIVLANSKAAPAVDITLRHLYLALAKNVPGAGGALIANPHRTWQDVDPSLPNVKIEVLGPPPTSGTRDAFVELAMEGGCKTFPAVKALKKSDRTKYKAVCHGIREDGAFIQAGENDVLIVRKLEENKAAFGIFGFSFLDQNADRIQGSRIGAVSPTFENIAEGKYPISRPLFFYVKKAHVGTIPGLEGYIKAFTSENAWGPDGYLADKGLIPMPDAERNRYSTEANRLLVNVMM